MARYKLVTFDVYAALFDLEGSMVPEVRAVLPPEVDPVGLFRLWRSKQLEFALISNSLGRGHLKFKYLTERALEYALKRHNLELPADTRASLVAAWNRLRPWPEAGEVLAGVRARGCLTALLSNGDEAMLRELAATLPVPVDHIFAADQAGFYKPHPAIYELPLKVLGLDRSEVLHVAGSASDVMGARSFGLPCAWSNRGRDYVLEPDLGPDFEFPDLTGVLSLL
jgi:2-haloacid dehalogenase